VGFGEEIYLIGNVPALGCNSIERAIPLVTSAAEFPWWRTKEGKLVALYPMANADAYLKFWDAQEFLFPVTKGQSHTGMLFFLTESSANGKAISFDMCGFLRIRHCAKRWRTHLEA
jgi:hypothetical protein